MPSFLRLAIFFIQDLLIRQMAGTISSFKVLSTQRAVKERDSCQLSNFIRFILPNTRKLRAVSTVNR